MSRNNEQKMRAIRIEVTTAVPLPAGEQVFVTGNTEQFGFWDPRAYPLTREKDNLWARTIYLPADQTIEYKITRGSWSSEEVTPDGNLPANKVIEQGEDDVTVEHWIHHWKDLRMGPPPQIVGHYDILENVFSSHLKNARTVLVWLPPSYYNNRSRRYPVIYMQDGQQVFDPNTATWQQAWKVDEWCTRLMNEGAIREAIVVAAYCTPRRDSEYHPDEQADDYIAFLTEELMPLINRDFRTMTGPENTGIAGASLGGTLAFYAAWKHPGIFSKAACLSPAFAYNDSTSCFQLVKNTKQKPDIKIYLYCGGGDDLERKLLPDMCRMADLLVKNKFVNGKDLLIVEDPEAGHNEAAWCRHTVEWLLFLLACP